jgi:hypothetical protein
MVYHITEKRLIVFSTVLTTEQDLKRIQYKKKVSAHVLENMTCNCEILAQSKMSRKACTMILKGPNKQFAMKRHLEIKKLLKLAKFANVAKLVDNLSVVFYLYKVMH